jgi:hypothetical protein
MAVLRRIRWLQFRLRTLLIACTLAGVALGLWFRPYTIETRRDDGSLRTRFEVRRDWRGNVVAHGTQTWYFHDGTIRQHTDYGTRLNDDEFSTLLMKKGDFDGLIWLITETIAPESWSDSDGPSRFNINALEIEVNP